MFAALIKREPKTEDETRIVELAQIALGRLYYERDQPTKAIDAYLLIDRKSDLFDEETVFAVAATLEQGAGFAALPTLRAGAI